MADDFEAVANAILHCRVTIDPRIPGVFTILTDRQSSTYGPKSGARAASPLEYNSEGVTPYLKALTLVSGLLAVWAGLCAI